MRKPSLHIREDQLYALIIEHSDNARYAIPARDLVDFIMNKGRKLSLRHRSLLENAKNNNRANGMRSSTKDAAWDFSKLVTLIRKKRKHMNVKLISEKDGAQWNFLLQASGLALQFCKDYNIKDRRVGFISYIEMSLDLMKPFGFNRFKSFDPKVRENYESKLLIENDPRPSKTNLIYELYEQRLFEKTGQKLNYKDRPSEYKYFVEASQISHDLGIHPKHYLIAQFDQLDFTNGYPTPSQLATFKARERALRWVTENNIIVKKKQEELTDKQKKLWAKYE